MKIKILMMFKNENDLLEPWLKYHASLVGADNLIVFDNGSDDEKTLNVIDKMRSEGFTILDDHPTQKDFIDKGTLFTRLIKQMDEMDPADFYFPLDCDEFLAVAQNGQLDLSLNALKEELKGHSNAPYPMRIWAGLDNNPIHAGFFRWSRGQKKTFFARNACEYLDHGYHNGQSKSGEDPIITNIVYVHFHYKPYDKMVYYSKQKLLPFWSDFSREGLENCVKNQRSSWHCAAELLKSEEEYAQMFPLTGNLCFDQIKVAFKSLGLELPFFQDFEISSRQFQA